VRIQICAICGKRKTSGEWFLVTENRWEDKLSILQWHDALSRAAGVHRACCAAHVRELVVHWMTTGSLNYPFAQVAGVNHGLGLPRSIWAPRLEVDVSQARLIGEITVDRESVGRLLAESSCSLTSMLAVLDTALRQEQPSLLAFRSPGTPFHVAQPEL
jgi:hypothetical protein